jgi:hypothetical protein
MGLRNWRYGDDVVLDDVVFDNFTKYLQAKKKAELKAEEEKRKQSRDSLREKAALWK